MSAIICTECAEAIEFRVQGSLGRFVTVSTGATYCKAHPALGSHTLPRAPFVALTGKIGPAFDHAEDGRTASVRYVVGERDGGSVHNLPTLDRVFRIAGDTVGAEPWTASMVGQPYDDESRYAYGY